MHARIRTKMNRMQTIGKEFTTDKWSQGYAIQHTSIYVCARFFDKI